VEKKGKGDTIGDFIGTRLKRKTYRNKTKKDRNGNVLCRQITKGVEAQKTHGQKKKDIKRGKKGRSERESEKNSKRLDATVSGVKG